MKINLLNKSVTVDDFLFYGTRAIHYKGATIKLKEQYGIIIDKMLDKDIQQVSLLDEATDTNFYSQKEIKTITEICNFINDFTISVDNALLKVSN